MIWVLCIIGVLIGLFAALFVWGMLRVRAGGRMAILKAQELKVSDIDRLVHECVKVFDQKLAVQLDLDRWEDAAKKLDAAFIDKQRLKSAFEREGFYWYFVLPVGACLGELLRRHARHEWKRRAGEAPHMEVQVSDGVSEIHPFEKVVKHAQLGDPGDLFAYVVFGVELVQDSPGK
jgi:hypothetical protein